jgi:hypothetical protein
MIEEALEIIIGQGLINIKPFLSGMDPKPDSETVSRFFNT